MIATRSSIARQLGYIGKRQRAGDELAALYRSNRAAEFTTMPHYSRQSASGDVTALRAADPQMQLVDNRMMAEIPCNEFSIS